MNTVNASLAMLAQGVADELRSGEERRVEPPPGIPERSLIWLALAPVWTPRMAAACGFPAEADEQDSKIARRRLERQAAEPNPADPGTTFAARHVLGVIALSDGHLPRATDLFRTALEGFHQVGHRSGAVAAQYHLGEIAATKGDFRAAATWLGGAARDEVGAADDVCAAVVGRRLTTLTSPSEPTTGIPAPLNLDISFDNVSIVKRLSRIEVPPELAPAVLESTRVLDRMAEAGVCSVVLGDAPETETEVGDRLTERRYFMTDLVRQQVVEQVMRDPSKGIEAIKRELEAAGQRSVAAARAGVPMLRSTRQWARLAALAGDLGAMAELLSSECDRLLTAAPPDEVNPSGTVLAWIQAAEPLEELLKGELTVALDRAKRQLDLFHRRRDDDQRYLRHFQGCSEQISAINDLLSDDGSWALHFAGAGGTGKTMLMRYICSVLGPELGASTARIDFDYLSPDYPAERPGLLLAELAEELRLSAQGAAISLFSRFDDEVATLHEQRTGSGLGQATASAERIGVEQVLGTFSRALAELPRPVILLIDTCEELAKVRPDGTSPEGVTRTFAILEELRRTVPELKVIFAGRRPLASKGDGWDVRSESELPERLYLRLCEVRGFTRDEALAYLASEHVPSHLRDAMLDQAQNRSQIDPFTYADPARAAANTPRYIPFELSGWAALTRHRDGASLTVADITATDADRYIELRIIRRIRYEPLKRALPAIGLLGRCDRGLLLAALPDLPDFEKMFAELRQQEWITRRGIEFYEVDEGLRRRLLAHYERTKPDEVEHCYQRLAEHLERRTIDDPLADLLPFHFDTAMRVLRRDPVRAARWWAKAESRFAAERQFDWARQLCEFMLGPDGICADRPPTGPADALRAGVLATQMACFTHTRPQADRSQGWLEVTGLLTDYPDEKSAERLRLRATFGLIATVPLASARPNLRQLLNHRLSQEADAQLDASMLAALETVIEHAEQDPSSWLPSVPTGGLDPDWSRLEDRLPLDLLYFLMSLCGRLALLSQNYAVAVPLLYQAANDSHAHYSPDLAGSWLDWRQPDDLFSRLALEFIKGAYPAFSSPREVLGHLPRPRPMEPPETIDGERLMSAELTLLAALAPVDPEAFLGYSLRRVLQYPSPHLRPTRNVHRAFAALPTVAAEQMAGAGDVDLALDLLTAATSQWERSSRELDSVTDGVRAQLRIIRRMRLRDEGLGSGGELDGSPSLADRELLWSLDGLAGAKAMPDDQATIELHIPEGEDLDAWRHARWRTLSPLAWSEQAIDQFARAHLVWDPEVTTLGTFADISACFDVIEHLILADRPDRPDRQDRQDRRLPANLAAYTSDGLESVLVEWWRDHPDQPEQALQLQLRGAVLQRRPSRPLVPKDLIDRLGRRRAALIALEEGEMLGLRLPDRARPIVDLAGDWFDQCRDYAGAIIACTLSALLAARLGQTAGPGFDTDVGTYLRFLPGLPTMADVQSIATSPSSVAMEKLRPPSWRPWLVRLVTYQAWSDTALRRAVSLRWFHDWIQRYYGTTKYGAPGLGSVAIKVPAELDGWLQTSPHAQRVTRAVLGVLGEIVAALTLRQLRRVRDLRKQGKPYLRPAAEALAPFIFVLTAVAVEVSTALNDFKFVYSWLPSAVLVVFGTTLFSISKRTRYRFTRVRLGRAEGVTPILATVTISPGLDPAPGMSDARATLTTTSPLADAVIRVPDLEHSFVLGRRTLPESFGTELARLDQVRDRHHILGVQIPRQLAAICWEAVFASKPDAPLGELGPLRIVRTLPERRTRPVRSWRAMRSAVSIVADLNQAEMAASGWAPLIDSRRYEYGSGRPDELSGSRFAGLDIVHIVATPIETASGLRLDLGRTAGQSPRPDAPRGELMQPFDMLARFPDVAFCVLQATPTVQALRSEAERQQAAGLREFAAEIFSLGVPVVVTIPPLSSSMAVVVLGLLSEAVKSRPRRFVAALTEALRQAADRLASTPGLSPECAFDLCLYADQGQAAIAKASRGDKS